MKQLRDNLWELKEDYVHCFLVVGHERALLVDTGFGVQNFQEKIASVTNCPVTLVNTHADIDHVGGNTAFADRYIHPADVPSARQLLPEDQAPYQAAEDGLVFDLGGTEIEVIHFPGHTPGSILLYNRKENYIIGGDSLGEEPIWLFGEGRDLHQFRESLLTHRTLIENAEVAYASHGHAVLERPGELLADILGAVDDYLTGKPASGSYRVDYDPENIFYVPEYDHGRGSVLVEPEQK
jgi:hydroxyacylglutathione hydrolase